MKFIKNIGNTSTTAWIDGKRIGRNVNAALYEEKGAFIVKLENDGRSVKGVGFVTFKDESSYRSWQDNKPEGLDLMLYSLRLFDCETSFDAK
jgi:hypothetical protein